MRVTLLLVAFAVLVGLLLSACQSPPKPAAATQPAGDPMVSVNTLYEAPPDFLQTRIGSRDFPLPPYARFLKGVKICLDPGHGGDAHKRAFKRGPSGVREAEVNLRVAQYLRELLTRCGAEVKLTREGDTDSSLTERANVANDWGADLFISLHHNAIGNKPQVNHTTVWYHADVDYRPSNLDLARHLCQGLYDTLALPEISEVPLKSDQLMYKTGFGVLAAAKVTAALCETSFFTNPEEEQRLRTPEWNLKEAYGLYLGLARYAAAGLPRARLADPADGIIWVKSFVFQEPLNPEGAGQEEDLPMNTGPEEARGRRLAPVRLCSGTEVLSAAAEDDPNSRAVNEDAEFGDSGEAVIEEDDYIPITFVLDDGLRGRKSWGAERQMIITTSLAARLDGEEVPLEFENDGYRLTLLLPPDVAPGPHAVEVQFMNMNKNSVLNPHFSIEVREVGEEEEIPTSAPVGNS